MDDSRKASLDAETDQIMSAIRDELPRLDARWERLAAVTADGIAEEFPDTPGIGRIVVAAIAFACGTWHAVNPDHEIADAEQVIALLGAAAGELQRREQASSPPAPGT